jgi:methionyl-tRNA synthetase
MQDVLRYTLCSNMPETKDNDFTWKDFQAKNNNELVKLLKLTIDTGLDKRTVVSGIAEWYKPEDAIGKKVSILVNLAPRKIKGIESKGMILMAENPQGELSFVTATKEETGNGSIIK